MSRWNAVLMPDDEVLAQLYARSSCVSDLCKLIGTPAPHARRVVPILERLGLDLTNFPFRRSSRILIPSMEENGQL